MIVAFDNTSLINSGIYRYTDQLIRNLKNIDSNITIRTIGPREPANKRYSVALKNFLYNHFFLGKEIKTLGAQIYHCTKNFPVPSSPDIKSVATIHDIIPLALRKDYCRNLGEYAFYRLNFYNSLKQASAVISISTFTRDEIIKYYPNYKNKVHLIYQGCDPNFHQNMSGDQAQTMVNTLGVYRPYIFTMGGAEPRKNVQSLINLFCNSFMAKDIDLVVLGNKWRGRSLHIPSYCKHRVHCFNSVSLHELIALYSASKLFVFPSLYEGFGLPILEAMACGTPVIAHNGTSIPEVAGNAAVLIDMRSSHDCTKAIKMVLESISMCDELIAGGKERVRLFPWEITAKETLALYKAVNP